MKTFLAKLIIATFAAIYAGLAIILGYDAFINGDHTSRAFFMAFVAFPIASFALVWATENLSRTKL